MTPEARRTRLIVEDLGDETVIYDQESEKAISLNRTSALIWKLSDGSRTVPQLANLVAEKLSVPLDEELVWYGLSLLEDQGLLTGPATRPAGMRFSRRSMVKRLGIAVAMLPIATALLAPTPAEAVTISLILPT